MSTSGIEETEGSQPDAAGPDAPVSLAKHFTGSAKFRELFNSGMELVEETAGFLDGEGRIAAKDLSQDAQVLFGTESMRLTTRLMQLASWLLLQRAVTDGEMTSEQALSEKQNVKLDHPRAPINHPSWDELPKRFQDLVFQSARLQGRIQRLDRQIYEPAKPATGSTSMNAVAAQHNLLTTAFDPRYGQSRS